MALTPTEIELIKALSRRQDQLELMIGSAIGGLPGRGLVMLDQELGRRNFLLNRSNEESNLFVGELAKEVGTNLKKKRKVSKYQKEFGKQFKKLKKKHPRTSPKMLMKKAHRATKKVMK
jgi:hypothetical protein